MKKIIIAGGTGFLGKALEQFFKQKDDEVIILTRNPKAKNHRPWDAKQLGDWTKELEGTDVLINLTGKCVDCRYTPSNKKEIIRSRVESTLVLNEAVAGLENPPKVWLNASSATIYVHAESQLMKESGGIIGDDFSMNVCKKWEKAFYAYQTDQIRKVALRIAIVMGNEGGGFPKMRMLARLGFGGAQGRGDQKVSWIHIDDFCRAVEFIIEQEHISGSTNLSVPEPISNQHLMKSIRKRYRIPIGIGQPVFLLEFGALLLGTETELLLKSRNVYPERLLNASFKFKYPRIEPALSSL